MNYDHVEDLKQFVAAAVTQAGSEIREDVGRLRAEVQQLARSVVDMDSKLDAIMEATGEQLTNHEARLARLEREAA